MLVGRKKTEKNANHANHANASNTSDSYLLKNARDVSRVVQEKRASQFEHFSKVLRLCQVEISKCVDLGYTHCIFEVPSFLVGHPLYDINECIVYVLRKLQEHEYHVSYYFPNTIYITWPIEESPDDKINFRFMTILEDIKRKHTYQNNNPSINPSNFVNPMFSHENTEKVKEITNQKYLEPSKWNDIQNWNLKNQITMHDYNKDDNKDDNKGKIKNIDVKVKPIKSSSSKNEKNNEEIKLMLKDPFYFIDKEKENSRGRQDISNVDALSMKSKHSQHSRHSGHSHRSQNNHHDKNDQNDQNDKNDKKEENNVPKSSKETSKKRTKSKNVKNILDLKNKKGFVLDLS